MNIRNVLRTYSLLRQLTDDETALLETLRGLNDTERESLVVALQPEKTAGKRAGKKSSRSASKSSRASGIAAVIAKSLNQPREGACAHMLENGAMCNTGDNNPIHDESFGYAGYHPFVSAAQPARGRSSANGEAGNTTQNIETGADAAQDVAASSN